MQAEASFPRRAETLGAYAVLARVSPGYPPLPGRLSTCYSPVRRFTHGPKPAFSLDLHVLSTPPAFILSQDQTLQFETCDAAAPEGPAATIALTNFLVRESRRLTATKLAGTDVGSSLFSFQRTGHPLQGEPRARTRSRHPHQAESTKQRDRVSSRRSREPPSNWGCCKEHPGSSKLPER